jgi:hypothetical protein
MNTRHYYAQARQAGHQALSAWRTARTVVKWQEGEGEFWRLRAEPEEESYCRVYGKPDDAREKAATDRLLEQWGCWCVVGEFLGPDGRWHQADSVGMCVYEDPMDWRQNWYVPDIMAATMRAYDGAGL